LCLHIHTITFYFHLYRHHRDLHSFPTRRSSDLIPVMFQIPSDAAETNVSNMRDAIQWKLHAHADLPGVNYDAEFDVPVFRTKDSAPGRDPPQTVDAPKNPTIRVQPTNAGGMEFVFPAARTPAVAAGVTLIFLL